MAAIRVAMGPVDDTALFVPFVFTVKRHRVALAQTLDARGDVDIVGHQHGLARSQRQNESLMTPTTCIVGENTPDNTFPAYLPIALPIRVSPCNLVIILDWQGIEKPEKRGLPGQSPDHHQADNDGKNFPHQSSFDLF
jgi:hypothetical protein